MTLSPLTPGRLFAASLASRRTLCSKAVRVKKTPPLLGTTARAGHLNINSFVTPSTPEDECFYPLEPLTSKKLKSKTNLWYHRKPHKRASTIMDVLNRESAQLRRNEWQKTHAVDFPEFLPGDALEVTFKGSLSRTSMPIVFRGVVIGRRNAGFSSSFRMLGTVNRTTVEYVFPLYSPLITNIRVVSKAYIHGGKKRVRRAKLYYLKDRPQSQYTLSAGAVKSAMEAQAREAKVKLRQERAEARERKEMAKAAEQQGTQLDDDLEEPITKQEVDESTTEKPKTKD